MTRTVRAWPAQMFFPLIVADAQRSRLHVDAAPDSQ
jgi:hypothetical protein